MARTLIIDDSVFQRMQVAKILRGAGHEVLEASGGQEGIELAARDRPDCILLDLLMPEVSGFEVLEALHGSRLEIPVIILTADIQETTRRMCHDLGARDFLNKPPKPEKLLEAVETVLCA